MTIQVDMGRIRTNTGVYIVVIALTVAVALAIVAAPIITSALIPLTFLVALLAIQVIIATRSNLWPFHPLLITAIPIAIGYVWRTLYIVFIDKELLVGFGSDGVTWLNTALWLVVAGVIAMQAGYIVGGRQEMVEKSLRKDRLGWLWLIYVAVGASVFLATTDMVGISSVKRDVPQWTRTMLWFLYDGVALGLMWLSLRKRGYIPWILWVCAVGLALYTGIYYSSRSVVLMVVMMIVAIWHMRIRRLRWPTLVMWLVVLVVASSIVLSARRGSRVDLVDTLVSNRDFSDIVTTAHIARHVHNTGDLLYGSSMTALATRFVPRFLWPNKPHDLGVDVSSQFYDYALNRTGVQGVPPSLIAELYWNFHLPGVLAGMWVFGMVLRYITRQGERGGAWSTVLYVALLWWSYSQVAGDITPNVGRLVQAMAPLWVVRWIAYRSLEMD